MNIKKIIFMSLILVVSLTLVSSANDVTIEYWNMFGGGDGDYMDQLIEEFNETHPNIKVNSTRLEWAEYYTKLITAAASGTGPDVAASHITKLPELYEQGLLYSLDKTAEEINLNWENLNQNLLEKVIFDNEYYAIPIDAHPIVLFFNKDYFAEAGMLSGEGNIKLKDGSQGFIESFNKVVKNSKAEYGLNHVSLPSAVDNYRLWWTFYSQLGGKPFINDNNVNIDKEIAVKAMKYQDKLYGTIIPDNVEYMEAINMFRNKESAALITGVWATGMIEETEDLNFGISQVPQIFNKIGAWADSHTLVLPYNPESTSEKQKAALIFAKWITENGQIWAKAGHIPSNELVQEKAEYKNLEYRKDYAVAADTAFLDQLGVQTWAIRDNITQNISLLLTDKTTAEEAVEKMINEIEQIINR